MPGGSGSLETGLSCGMALELRDKVLQHNADKRYDPLSIRKSKRDSPADKET